MELTLSSDNYTAASNGQKRSLDSDLRSILQADYDDDLLVMLARYQRVLADNQQRQHWPEIHEKLKTLFLCGRFAVLDGPKIGVPVAIRDSDFFADAARFSGRDRSLLASVEVMATAWNATLADTGLWMGKTFEPVAEAVVREKTDNDPAAVAAYDAESSRIGRNFFREPPDPNLLQGLALPVLEKAWKLRDRPLATDAPGFAGELLAHNLEQEKAIPYSKTGGIYLAEPGLSVVPGMHGKQVYQLNYRWPRLDPVFPMTLLVDEIVQLGDGIYLGQLVYATRHFSLGRIDLPLVPGPGVELGEAYAPQGTAATDYGYQNNGYFLMLDPAIAHRVYADDAFPQLRPRRGEIGFEALGHAGETAPVSAAAEAFDWVDGWRGDATLKRKFTELISEESTRSDDGDAGELLQAGESVLQMLKRLSDDISAQTRHEDHLRHFEALHRLFRCGVAPGIDDGLFRGLGERGFNVRLDGVEQRDWYGESEVTRGFDYYHGANLNLHWGFAETFCPERDGRETDMPVFPAVLAQLLSDDAPRGPNLMNMIWHSIGKYIFPWAGKSFEKISPRKLSMLLDESADLEQRYPERVRELQWHLAGFPHYALVLQNRKGFCPGNSVYTEHLAGGSWDQGMSAADRDFWTRQADEKWLMGYNLQDKRIVAADALMRASDLNYRVPEGRLQQASAESGSPFARQGYCFLGVADERSILPMNNGDRGRKRVFQFHYRFPMIGGPVPIGFCLDELVEIADGLYLGQLIYSTAIGEFFHSSREADDFKYQLFGYFLLLDDDWERHRQAIGLDTID